ncbi:MAG TPA: carboxypeptidase-like regulatory domain-containing protein [Actinomycetota bacterium]|nr:carboxypeptidase-like regulatory domain-containing protein [Actinomycetota bacterium]
MPAVQAGVKRFALVLVLVVAGAVASCGGDGAGDGSSGIRGRALSGPRCPVEVEGSACPDLPWRGTVIAVDTETGEEFTVTTDADGRFRLPLEPGTYEVSIVSESSPPFAKPQTVTVDPGSFTEIAVSVDTGIR